jgi:hypothetical protein
VAGDDEEMQQRFVPIEDLFKGRHFDRQIIVLCVSWYTSFKLSLRDLVIMMADRGISVTHTTILRWVQHYLPEFEKRWQRYARPVGGSWRNVSEETVPTRLAARTHSSFTAYASFLRDAPPRQLAGVNVV